MSTKRTASKMSKDGYINPYTNYDENGKFITLDYEGNVVERTEHDHPYSFSERCIWAVLGSAREKIDKMTSKAGIYSDRLMQEDSLKFDIACRSVWGNAGQRFDTRSPKDIEQMLQIIYANRHLKLYRIVKSCNVGNGYPLWYFSYYIEE